MTGGFVALPYAQSGVPFDDAVVVRVRVRESEWEEMGVPSTMQISATRVNADVLLGQDGVPRAIRLVGE